MHTQTKKHTKRRYQIKFTSQICNNNDKFTKLFSAKLFRNHGKFV